jgi:hypothetical protein
MPQRYIADLMRYTKHDKRVALLARVICDREVGHTSEELWRWIGGADGYPHPHPLCCYWIQDVRHGAVLPTDESHLIRSEN